MKNPKDFFNSISYLQYPFILIGAYYAFHPYFNEFVTIWSDLNNVLIYFGLGISFSTLQDTTKTQNKFTKRIWENPKKGKRMIFFILPVALYLVIIFLIPILWRIIGASFKESDSKIKQLTLIVPFRNESENLGDLLKSIEGLKTNIHLKYIFVNDHSEDNGADLVKNWVKEKEGSALLIELPQGCNGKKTALNIAMDHVDTEWVWQLDADTSFNPNVLELLEYAANSNQKLILAPVIVKANKKAYKNQFQIFENIVLQFITSLFAQINSAFLANGANLFYTKSVFKDYQKQNVGANFASGDDLFLLFFVLLLKLGSFVLPKHYNLHLN